MTTERAAGGASIVGRHSQGLDSSGAACMCTANAGGPRRI